MAATDEGTFEASLNLEMHAKTRFLSFPLEIPREFKSDGSNLDKEAKSVTPT